MKMGHILIEGYCDKEAHRNVDCSGKMSSNCIECNCFSYTDCPNEICITDNMSEAIDFIGFGGEMEPDEVQREVEIERWTEICKTKIKEAYDEYMSK